MAHFPVEIQSKAVTFVAAKLNGDRDQALRILPDLMVRDVIQWSGGDQFELDDTHAELDSLCPALVNENKLAASSEAGRRRVIDLYLLRSRQGFMPDGQRAPVIPELNSPRRLTQKDFDAAVVEFERKYGDR